MCTRACDHHAVPDVVAELAQVRLFARLDEAALTALAGKVFLRRLARGQVLFTEGEPSEHLYVVRSGRLRVYVSSPRGDQLVLSVLGVGEALGELSVLDGRPRSAGVDALDAVELIVVSAAEVRALLQSNHEAVMAVALELASVIRRLTGNAADLVFLDLPRRLAKLLIAQSVTLADGRTDSLLQMNQSGVAAQLGVTRQSLNRALAGLAKRGWIQVEGVRVRLRDVEAMRRFADS
jgi:CRP/FNR family cyclic AMP-dependent transcriptional regulator